MSLRSDISMYNPILGIVTPLLIAIVVIILAVKFYRMEQAQVSQGGEKKSMRKSWFLKWILALGIVIVLNLLFNYGIRSFYKPGPEYNDYCKQEQVTTVPDNQEACVSAGGAWTTNPSFGKPYDTAVPTRVDQNKGYCDLYFSCGREFEDALRVYNRNAFIIWVVLGILAIIGSLYFAHVEAVSLGFSLGGVVAVIVGSVNYWSNMDDKLRFGVLLVGFITLVWLGIKKIRD